MISKIKSNKGFTLIELIVVIAVIGILVLLAAPKLLGYTEDAKVAQIKHDVKVVGDKVTERLSINEVFLETDLVGLDRLEGIASDGKLFDFKGQVSEIDEKDKVKEYYEVSEDIIRDSGTKLKGAFYSSNGGKTYYEHTKSLGGNVDVNVDENVDPHEGIYLATDEDFSGDADGEFKYIGTEPEVRIPHVIKGVNVTSYEGMFIPEIDEIDDNYEPIYKTDVPIRKVVSTNKGITNMRTMFRGSQGTSLDLRSLDTSNVTDMDYMFWNNGIKTLDLSKFDTSSVTNMQYMFKTSQAESLDLRSFDTRNVIDMQHMFERSQATSLDISSFNTSNVTNMYGMFQWSQATSLDLSKFDTSKVTEIRSMFNHSQATSLDLSSFDTSKVTVMDSMFMGSEAKSLDLSDWDTSNVYSINHMFYNSKAKTLDLSNFDIETFPNLQSTFTDSKATSGYAKTAAEADHLNATSSKPSTLVFVVKP